MARNRPYPRSAHRGQKSKGDEMPWALVDATMGEDLAEFGELQLAANEPIRELPWLDRERADVAGDLLVILGHAFSKDGLEHADAGLASRAVDQGDEMW